MKISVLLRRQLLIFFARAVLILCCGAFSFVVNLRMDIRYALMIFLPLRLLLISPLKIYIYAPDDALNVFSAFSSAKAYFGALAVTAIRLFCYALMIAPIAAAIMLRTLPTVWFSAALAAALAMSFALILIYQRTFAVSVFMSQGCSVIKAYRHSFAVTKGCIGDVCEFYLKWFWLPVLVPLVLPYLFIAPFFHKQLYQTCFARWHAGMPAVNIAPNEVKTT